MPPQQVNPSAIQTPASPLGNFPELANMYRSSFQLPLASANVSSQNVADQTTLANQKAQADADAQAQKDATDPSKYSVQTRNDGGFGFYDPTGKEITAAQYAAATGKNPQEVLKNSTNPIDIGYQKDFKDLQDYINLKLQSSKDTDAATKAKAIEQEVQKTTGVNLAKLTPAQVIQQFQAAYPTIYGANPGNAAGVKAGTTFIPQATNSFVQNSQSTGGQGVN